MFKGHHGKRVRNHPQQMELRPPPQANRQGQVLLALAVVLTAEQRAVHLAAWSLRARELQVIPKRRGCSKLAKHGSTTLDQK
jgi:hypothetical protein